MRRAPDVPGSGSSHCGLASRYRHAGEALRNSGPPHHSGTVAGRAHKVHAERLFQSGRRFNRRPRRPTGHFRIAPEARSRGIDKERRCARVLSVAIAFFSLSATYFRNTRSTGAPVVTTSPVGVNAPVFAFTLTTTILFE